MSLESSVESLNGQAILGWVRRGVDVLQRRRDEINSMNVFPVPDSDTGSNMLATLGAAYSSAEQVDSSDVRAVAAALAAGAVRGARGNSGTVLSQVFRALAEAASDRGITVAAIRHALKLAVRHVAHAIANPVEGTILTVLRHAAVSAEEYQGESVAELAAHVATAARDALGKTPSQLSALRDAGVVDAGGAGLVLLLDALSDEISGRSAAPVDLHVDAAAPSAPEMEVMYVISLQGADAAKALRERLDPLGNSLIVAGEGEPSASAEEGSVYMVHIHSTDPGAVIEAALDFGRPEGIRIEVLEGLSVAVGGEGSATKGKRVVIAVVPEGPLTQLVSSSGSIAVSPTPRADASQDADSEFDDDVITKVLAAMRSVPGTGEVMLLPNGLVSGDELVQIEMTAAAGQHTLGIVPTDSIASGLAALAVHDASRPLAVDAYAMSEASSGIRTACLNAEQDRPLDEALVATVTDMLGQGGELITLLLGNHAVASAVEVLRAELARTHAHADVVAYDATGIDDAIQIGIE